MGNRYVVLIDGKTLDLVKMTSERTVLGKYGTITTITTYFIKDNKLYQGLSYREEDAYSSHSWSDMPTFVGAVKFTYSDNDLEEAKFLVMMEKYFPILKPWRVSATIKELIKRLKKGEK